MRKKIFDIKSLFYISLLIISFFSIFNFFFGDKSFKKYQNNVDEILMLNNKLTDLEVEKDNLTYFIREFQKDNLDFKEVVIRKELNFLGFEENVIFYD
tara:strand:+ start:587 stop:880 length:294 start_codon:yes stop_codon:yes gene_type:complete